MIVQGILKQNQNTLKGKTVIPFCTFGSVEGETLKSIVDLTPFSKYLKGYGTSSPNKNQTENWLKEIGF